MRSIEGGLEQEGIVTSIGMHRDVNRLNTGLLQFQNQLTLFLRVEAEVRVDGEYEKALTSLRASSQEVAIVFRIALTGSIIP